MPYKEINWFKNNEKNGRKNGKQKLTHWSWWLLNKNWSNKHKEDERYEIYLLIIFIFQFFFIKSGYLGLIMNPRGDFNLACYYLLGCLGLSILCLS